jgi:hypothetical protein
MRCRLWISVSILAVVAVGLFVGGWLMLPKPRINEESFGRIKIGMTQAQVEEIIGAPPGDYGVSKCELDVWHSDSMRLPAWTCKQWLGQHDAITVWLDAEGKVADLSIWPVFRDYDSTFDQLLGYIGLKEKHRHVMIVD